MSRAGHGYLVCCALALGGCVETTSVTCPDGSVCPSGTQCAAAITLAGTERVLCVYPDQLSACVGKDDGDSCELADTIAGGTCHSDVCIPVVCGNGFLDTGEVCDDENLSNADDCSDTCRSTLVCGNGVRDEIRDEQCDLGDMIGHDGCASTCQLERARWVALGNERPSPRTFGAFAYDLGRRSAVLFGGSTDTGAPLDDTTEWDGKRWRAAPSATSPSNRYAHTMAYDAARNQLVVFSGVNNQADTWVRDDGGWRQVVTAHAPPSRDYAGMAYDSAHKQIVLFGGFSTVTELALDDTWVWDGTDWREVTPPTRPPARLGAAMAYDSRRNVTVMFGGSGTVFVRENDVWEFDGTTWVERTPSTGLMPSPRVFASMAYDPTTGELLLTGGNDGTAPPPHDAYTWNGTRWLARAPIPVVDTDETFIAHVTATDPLRSRVVVLETKYGRLYEWNAPNWVAGPNGDGATFVPREGAAMVLDLLRNELVMFGGEIDGGPGTIVDDETWVFNGDSWQRSMPLPRPSPRWGSGIAYDEVRREIVLYGGCPASAETWVWKGDDRTWTDKGASSPGALCGASLAFDAKRGKTVLVGGYDGSTVFSTSTWTWDGSSWTLETTPTAPPPRAHAAIAYDRARENVVLFGGVSPSFLDRGDTWRWDGSAWTELDPPTAPPARDESHLAWDPARARVVLAAGNSVEGNYTFADAYEWDGMTWSAIVSDFQARRNPAMATAPDGAGIVMVGGNVLNDNAIPTVRLDETLRLRWDADVAYEACGGLDADGDGLAGCTDPDCWWACTPLCPPRTSCPSGGPGCGDQTCDPVLESCFSCPTDCGPCPVVCGDSSCGSGETIASCPGDCTP
jgi:cysteine-rich repeat protein